MTVVLGPAGSGKTEWCLRRYVDSGGAALLLVPSEPYGRRLKQRLSAGGSEIPTANIRTFGSLLREVAACGEIVVHRTCQRLALAGIVEEQVGPDAFFGRVRGMNGFLDALGDSIRELKLSGVGPELLASGVGPAADSLDDPAFSRKGTEIAGLFAAWQRFLADHGLCDEEDLPALAAERIRSGTTDPVDWAKIPAVLVDGFFRLSASWRDVLRSVSSLGVDVAVTLPLDDSRPLLFSTPIRTLTSLESDFTVRHTRAESGEGARPTPLGHLERNLFRPDAKPAVLPAGDAPVVRIFDAPNPYSEVEMVIRAIRREHAENATPWNRCAVILRSTADYGDLLRTVGEAYGVPVASGQGRSLADHPLVKTLLSLCSIAILGWRRVDVIGFLQSSYTPADKVAADRLRLMASRRGLREGAEGWNRLMDDLRSSGSPLAEMLDTIGHFASRVGAARSAADHAAALDACVKAIRVASVAGDEGREALGRWNEVVEQVVVASRLRERGNMSFVEFHRDLVGALLASPFSRTGEEQAVAVIEPYDTGQIEADFVAAMGLTERVFPRRINEDPFLRDDERVALQEAAGLDLERQADRADDERLLFYMAATAARKRLVLTFPRSAEESDTLSSFYLDEVRALFDHVTTEVRTLADVTPRQEECETDRDRLLAACSRLIEEPNGDPGDAAPLLETRHRPRLPAIPVGTLASHGASRRYSITELETYARCPFQHLMRYGLNAQALGDGAGDADKGTLLHAVMRRALRKRREEPPEEAEDARNLEAALTTELSACLGDRPIDASAYRKRMMERALSDTLREFARREVRYARMFGSTPAYFELAFGQEPGAQIDDEEFVGDEPRDCDPSSTPEPLVVDGGENKPAIHVCGTIDRVDLLDDGRRAIVLDYKLGNSVEWDRIRQGKSLQMALYMMAVEQLWGRTAAAGCYESPRDRGRRRFYRKSEVDTRAFQPMAGVEDGKVAKPLSGDDYAEAITAVQKAVRQAVERIQAGAVLPTPGEHCRWCEYSDVCRVGRDGVHDGEPYDVDGPVAGTDTA